MFDITTSADLYAMLVQDFDEYMTETHSARRVLHYAITDYHLGDWVWKDWLMHDPQAQKAIGFIMRPLFTNRLINHVCGYVLFENW